MRKTDIDPRTHDAVMSFLNKISDDYAVLSVILYGSRARGDQTSDSDADVAVVLNVTDNPSLGVSLAMSDVAYDTLLETGVNISPLPLSRNALDMSSAHPNPDLINNIKREGIVLWTAET